MQFIDVQSEKYEKIVKEWDKRKPQYEKKILTLNDKISALKNQIEDLIMERIADKERASYYDSMIAKREKQITKIRQEIIDCQGYDKLCREKNRELKDTAEIVTSVLSEGNISDINLRMLVKVIYIHQNDDNSLDIRVVMNGKFDSLDTESP